MAATSNARTLILQARELRGKEEGMLLADQAKGINAQRMQASINQTLSRTQQNKLFPQPIHLFSAQREIQMRKLGSLGAIIPLLTANGCLPLINDRGAEVSPFQDVFCFREGSHKASPPRIKAF